MGELITLYDRRLTEGFKKELEELRKAASDIPQEIHDKAVRIREFCQKELDETEQEMFFPLGEKRFPLGFTDFLTLRYTFRWCHHQSVGPYDNAMVEEADIQVSVSSNIGVYDFTARLR